jgi:REP-associated tyrosine transposase
MPRKKRLALPGFVHHIVHRSRDGDPLFLSERDFRFYLTNLRELRSRLGCKVHAYCLMLNHVHLLVDPGTDTSRLSRLMKQLSSRYAAHVSRTTDCGGNIWEQRFRASPVAPDFVLPVARYVEMNPVRTLLAVHPREYAWSSCPQHLDMQDRWLDVDPAPTAESALISHACYHTYLNEPIPVGEWSLIRNAIRRDVPTGDADFVYHLAQHFGHDIAPRPRGRPVSKHPDEQ